MSELQTPDAETFLGECHTLDMSELKDKAFLVAVNSGTRGEGKFICETSHGPYSFVEMCQEVGNMWKQYLHHSHVVVLSKDPTEMTKFLDEPTVDYIEARYVDLIMDSFMDGTISQEYDYKAGIITASEEEDPRKAIDEEKVAAAQTVEEDEY